VGRGEPLHRLPWLKLPATPQVSVPPRCWGRQYNLIVCGSGSSGSVVASRLAANPEVSVLLLEAGGQDDLPTVMRAQQWPLILGSEQDRNFADQPNPQLNGRSIPYDMARCCVADRASTR
jgi:choline dehydrogenase-like flavoprotein